MSSERGATDWSVAAMDNSELKVSKTMDGFNGSSGYPTRSQEGSSSTFPKSQDSAQLAGNLAEFPDAGFAGDPFGGAHSAFGEAAAREGFVLQLDEIALRAGFDDVDAGRVAFALRGNFDFERWVGGLEDVLDGKRGSGGRVFLPGVMRFRDAEFVIVGGGGEFARQTEHDLDADREVCAVEETSALAFGQ